MRKLREVMAMLINEQPLLPRHENHPLHGAYKGKWECHKEENKIIFYRTATHSDLY
jgi:addiction module RelE/StbE family toxin